MLLPFLVSMIGTSFSIRTHAPIGSDAVSDFMDSSLLYAIELCGTDRDVAIVCRADRQVDEPIGAMSRGDVHQRTATPNRTSSYD